MKNRHLERLKRKRMRYERTGNMTPIDPITGEDIGPDAEEHHIAGRRYHDDTILLSQEGHRKITDAQRDLPMPVDGPLSDAERIARYILNVILIWDFVADRLWEMALALIKNARAENQDKN